MPASTRIQFFNSKPADQVLYTTLEIYHIDIGVLRYVTGQQFDKTFTLETDAPRNANETVTFEAVAFDAPEPEQGEDGEVSLDIQLGAVGIDVKSKIKMITDAGWESPLEIVYRQHLSGETYPALVLEFEAETLTLQDLSAAIRAQQVNQAARDVAEIYTTDRFPGLSQSI